MLTHGPVRSFVLKIILRIRLHYGVKAPSVQFQESTVLMTRTEERDSAILGQRACERPTSARMSRVSVKKTNSDVTRSARMSRVSVESPVQLVLTLTQ
jgi:hypothetical protein